MSEDDVSDARLRELQMECIRNWACNESETVMQTKEAKAIVSELWVMRDGWKRVREAARELARSFGDDFAAGLGSEFVERD